MRLIQVCICMSALSISEKVVDPGVTYVRITKTASSIERFVKAFMHD